MTSLFKTVGRTILFVSIGLNVTAQSGFKQIHVRSDKDLIHFSPKIQMPDSACLTSGLQFYVLASETAKEGFHMYIENARLIRSGNDSLFQLEYLPGMQFEMVYLDSTDYGDTAAQLKKPKVLTPLLNGSTALPGDRIRIKIIKEKGEGLLYEKTFCFRN